MQWKIVIIYLVSALKGCEDLLGTGDVTTFFLTGREVSNALLLLQQMNLSLVCSVKYVFKLEATGKFEKNSFKYYSDKCLWAWSFAVCLCVFLRVCSSRSLDWCFKAEGSEWHRETIYDFTFLCFIFCPFPFFHHRRWLKNIYIKFFYISIEAA